MPILRTDINAETDIQRFAAAGPAAWAPYTGAAIDLDFAAQKYWWGGALKTTADFTTYVLSGSTFDPVTGLTPSTTIDVTIALGPLGTFIPGAFAAAVFNVGAPAATRAFFELDDGTNNERVTLAQTVAPVIQPTIIDGGAAQATIVGGAPSGVLATRIGMTASYATSPPDSVKASCNGTTLTADTTATMPTVTTLRVGKLSTAATNCNGSIARVVLFTSVKTQAELNALAVALRDGVVI